MMNLLSISIMIGFTLFSVELQGVSSAGIKTTPGLGKVDKARTEKSGLETQLKMIREKKQKPVTHDVANARQELSKERTFGVPVLRRKHHSEDSEDLKNKQKIEKLEKKERAIKKDLAQEKKLEKALIKEERLTKKRQALEETVKKGGVKGALAKGALKAAGLKEDAAKHKRLKAEQKAEKARKLREEKLEKKYKKNSFSEDEIKEISQGDASTKVKSDRLNARVQWKKDFAEQKRLEEASDNHTDLMQKEGSIYAKNLNDRVVRAANKDLSPKEKKLIGKFSKEEREIVKKIADNIDQKRDPIKGLSYEEAKKWEELSAVRLSKGIDEKFNKLRSESISITNDMIVAQDKAIRAENKYRSLFAKDASLSSPKKKEPKKDVEEPRDTE